MKKFDKKKSIFTYDGKYTYEYFVDAYKTYLIPYLFRDMIYTLIFIIGISIIPAILSKNTVGSYSFGIVIFLIIVILARLLSFNRFARKRSLNDLEKINDKNYNFYFYDGYFIFESENNIMKINNDKIIKIVESDKYIYINDSDKILGIKKELISNELYEYIINLKKDVYKRKGEINFNDYHKKKLVDILFWINVFLIFIMLYLIQSGIKLDILFYLLEIIPMITFIVGVSFKSDEKLNSKKDITIGIFCVIFIFLCFEIIDLGEHIGPYKLNDIGKKLDYNEFISITLPHNVQISEEPVYNPKMGKEKERNFEIKLNSKDTSNIEKSMKNSKNWTKGYLLKSDLYIFIDDFDYNDSSYYLIYNSDNKEYNFVPENMGVYKYYVASYNPNSTDGNIEISEFYYQYKK